MFLKRILCLTILGALAGALAQGLPEKGAKGIGLDRSSGLMWVADGNHMVSTGYSNDVVMTASEALAAIAAMNSGKIENFGFGDWRLPTPAELEFLLALNGENVDKILFSTRMPTKGEHASKVVWPVRGGVVSTIGNTVALATNSAYFKQGSQVISGDVVVNQESNGPYLASGMELTIGITVDTPAGYSVKADSIKLKDNSIVGGDIYYNELDNNGTVSGAEFTPLDLPVFLQLPAFVENDASKGTDILVNQNEFIVLDPGDYGTVTVKKNGIILFSGGIYNIAYLDSGTSTELRFAGASELRVADKFALDENSYFGPDDGSIDATDIIVYVAGINGNNGNLGATPRAAKIGQHCESYGTFYVPNGVLHIRQNSVATGAFLARDLLVGDGVTLNLNSYFGNLAPVAVDDAALVEIGGTVTALENGDSSLLDNDSDPEGGTLTVTTTALSGPDHGSLTLNADGTFSYTHDGGPDTFDSFVYEVCDNGSPQKCSSATVSISILSIAVTVSITKTGAGTGTVFTDPEGINCGSTCSAFFDINQQVFLLAVADPDSIFAGWGGDSDCLDGVLLPTDDRDCVATFDLRPPPPDNITVTVTKAGDGSGLVTTTPAGIDCGATCSAEFPEFSRIALEAQADAGSTFAGWSGDLDCLDGQLFGDVDKSCIATFDMNEPPPSTFNLRVQVIGTGGGTVTSNPFGLFCTDDCTLAFTANGSVSLFARADGSSAFVSWGGDCSGTGFSTSITMDSDKTCTATFNAN